MATKPIGEGTRNISVNVPKALHEAIKLLAKTSGMSVSQYVRTLAESAVQEQLDFRPNLPHKLGPKKNKPYRKPTTQHPFPHAAEDK